MRILACVFLLAMPYCQAANLADVTQKQTLSITVDQLEAIQKDVPLPRLQTIFLTRSKAAGDEKLTNLPILEASNLKHLSITDQDIKVTPEGINSHTYLQTLILTNNMIGHFSHLNLSFLEKLTLNKNSVTSISGPALEKLKYLFLADNLVQSVSLELLNQLPNLEYLDLSGNPLSAESIENIKVLRNNAKETGRKLTIVADRLWSIDYKPAKRG